MSKPRCYEFRASAAWKDLPTGGGHSVCFCGDGYPSHDQVAKQAGIHADFLRLAGWLVQPPSDEYARGFADGKAAPFTSADALACERESEAQEAAEQPAPASAPSADKWIQQLREWAADGGVADLSDGDCDELAKLIERLAEGRR
jgi:hypothetical protein